jgi:hypothetical protein
MEAVQIGGAVQGRRSLYEQRAKEPEKRFPGLSGSGEAGNRFF